jgi:hypothetical protein
MLKGWLVTIVCAVLSANAALAQQNLGGSVPPSRNGAGPSLEVTLQFIKEKLEAKGINGKNVSIAADPATCQFTSTRADKSTVVNAWDYLPVPGIPSTKSVNLTKTVSFSFRDLEKIEVSPLTNDDGSNAGYSLTVGMTTTKSVHAETLRNGKRQKHGAGDGDSEFWRAHFSDQDLANRVAKAMLHAAELCGAGGKQEPF